jgi:hypothetical protein
MKPILALFFIVKRMIIIKKGGEEELRKASVACLP